MFSYFLQPQVIRKSCSSVQRLLARANSKKKNINFVITNHIILKMINIINSITVLYSKETENNPISQLVCIELELNLG